MYITIVVKFRDWNRNIIKFIRALQLFRFHFCKPLWFKRYIDDCIGVWTHGIDKFKEFVNHLNSQHETIKFTYEFSCDFFNFLDTQVVIDKTTRRLYTRLYTKPTDTHSYVHATSCHHRPTIVKGPYGQFLRIRRICSRQQDFLTEMNKLISYYLKRGYNKSIVIQNYEKVIHMNQKDALVPKVKEPETDMTPIMVTNYNPRNPDIKAILTKHWNIIKYSDDCGKVFKSLPMVGFRRNKNLKDMLVKAAIQYPPVEVTKTPDALPLKRCRRTKCDYCNRIIRSETVKHSTSNQYFKTPNVPPGIQTTCDIVNVVYCIQCRLCGKKYVGETGRSLRDRLTEHLRDVQGSKNLCQTHPSKCPLQIKWTPGLSS